jgi:hypothetical protein
MSEYFCGELGGWGFGGHTKLWRLCGSSADQVLKKWWKRERKRSKWLDDGSWIEVGLDRNRQPGPVRNEAVKVVDQSGISSPNCPRAKENWRDVRSGRSAYRERGAVCPRTNGGAW